MGAPLALRVLEGYGDAWDADTWGCVHTGRRYRHALIPVYLRMLWTGVGRA